MNATVTFAQHGSPASVGAAPQCNQRHGVVSGNNQPTPEADAVIGGGGTILEMAAIDDPAIRPYLEEVRDRKQGPASEAMARQLLLSTLNGIEGGEALKQLLMEPGVTQPRGNMMPSVEPQTPAVPQPAVPQQSDEQKEKIARAQRTLALINRGMENIQERRNNNTGSGANFVIPDVGTYVEGTSFGFIPTNKYYAPDGSDLTKEEFDQRAVVAQKKLRMTIKDLQSKNTAATTTHKGPVIKSSTESPASKTC